MANDLPPEDDTALRGLRVLELSDEIGEYCGRLLAGLGADVLKVEPPAGERTRQYGPFLDDRPDPHRSLAFWHFNLGTRSPPLDLDDDADRATFRRLAADTDVLLTTRSPRYMQQR